MIRVEIEGIEDLAQFISLFLCDCATEEIKELAKTLDTATSELNELVAEEMEK